MFKLFDKNFNKFRTWQDTTGATQLGSLYRTTSATKGTAAGGRTFWISANIAF